MHVHDSISPVVSSSDPSAPELETTVKYQLHGRVRAFQLIVQDGGLVLRGQVRSYHAKQLAQHTVMEATGLPIFANEIEVTP